MGCCSSRQDVESSGEGEELTTTQNASTTTDAVAKPTLCERCAKIDWLDMSRQTCSTSTGEVQTENDISEPFEDVVIERGDFLTIDVSSLKKNCSTCLLFSALARKEKRRGSKVKRFTFGGEDSGGFYGDADWLSPRPYGSMEYNDPELPKSNESWCCEDVIGLAIQEHAGGAKSIPRTLRKIDPAKIDRTLLKDWISTCENEHGKDCNPSEFELVPFLRVIDVRTGIIEKAKEGCKYVALSYVWGSSQPPAKTSQNSQIQDVLDTAPETIKDAASLTEELGYRYIWIDRYCIPQDDPQAKHDQIQKMDLVYQQAELTIIAAAGNGPEFGLPGVGHRRRDAQLFAQVSKDTYLVSVEPKSESFFMSTWNTRGWTYQESICSRRSVVFTRREMFFQCKGMTCRETVREPGNKDFFISSINQGPISLLGQKLTAWDHIESYCRRNLTFHSDALNGILGILRLHRQSENPVYHFWGIPFSSSGEKSAEQGFLASLCWECILDPDYTPGLRPSVKIEEFRRQDFPSWSWTGWITPIRRFFNEYSKPPKLAGTVSICLEDGSTLGFQEAFEQGIKIGDFNKLSKFLYIECWTFELEFYIPTDESQQDPNHKLSPRSWAWPAGSPKLDDNSRVATPLELHEITPNTLSSNSNRPLLGLVFEGRETFTDTVIGSRRGSGEGVAEFIIVLMEKGDYYERIGYINVDHNNLHQISTSTFRRVKQNGTSFHSDSELSLPSLGDDDHGQDDDDDDINDDDDDEGDEGDDNVDDGDDGDGGNSDFGSDDWFRSFNTNDWLPKEFTWRGVKIG
ncbi:heterokaryon incompatibility protein-domain-containing protein [Annulohypoxylon moriforme]|nr:heterokaryon incompatibility protein-domain-containing protein [Annulohypoxylon moriforme]